MTTNNFELDNIKIKTDKNNQIIITPQPDDYAFDSFYDPSFTLSIEQAQELINVLETIINRIKNG